MDKIFSSATKKKIRSEGLYLLHINWILTTSKLPVEDISRKALAILDKSTAEYPESRSLALQQIRLLRTLPRSEQIARLPDIFARALKVHSESLAMWREYIIFLRIANREGAMSKEQVEKAFLDAIHITTSMLPDVTEERAEIGQIKQSVSAWFLDWMNEVEGITGVRRMYYSLMKKSLPELAFFMACINLEKNALDRDEDESRKAIVMLYDKAIHADDKNEGSLRNPTALKCSHDDPCALLANVERIYLLYRIDTYLSFLKYLNDTRQIEAANKVLWKASKVVADNDAFSQRYSDMLEGRWIEPPFEVLELDLDQDMEARDSSEALSS